jgi:plastocyanin
MYRIAWKSLVTGFEGRGEFMFTCEEAENMVAKLTVEYPEIHHWIESED